MNTVSSKGKIIVVSAPSGAGKTTLLNHVIQSVQGTVYSISATTRSPREGEVDGKNYFFLSLEEFKRKIELNEFAEWQLVHGNYYGTPRSFVQQTIDAGLHVLMDIDVYGKVKFDQVFPTNKGILILPPSIEALEVRLRNRGTECEDTIRVRIENARKEVTFAQEQGRYEYRIVNDQLDRAKVEIVSIVQQIISIE